MALLVDWESLEKFMMSWVFLEMIVLSDCAACSGVVVEGRVNEEDVLVVKRQVREQQRVRHVRTRGQILFKRTKMLCNS